MIHRALACVSLGLLASAGCRESARAQRGDPCTGPNVSASCADSVERAALAALPGWSRPTAAERVFRPPTGSELRLRDDSSEGFGYARYHLLGRLPGTRYVLVARTGYESYDYLLVSEGGDTVAVEGWPAVAPDGRRVAVASLDFDPCYQSNSLEVWRLEPRPPVREFFQETGDCTQSSGWGPSDVAWRDARTIEFTINRPAQGGADRTRSRGTLTRGAPGWTLGLPAAPTPGTR